MYRLFFRNEIWKNYKSNILDNFTCDIKNVYIYNHTGILSEIQIDVYQNFGQVTRRGLKEVSVTDQ